MSDDTGTLVIKSFPQDLHRRLRVAAAQRGCTMGQVIARALEAELAGPAAIEVPLIEGTRLSIPVGGAGADGA